MRMSQLLAGALLLGVVGASIGSALGQTLVLDASDAAVTQKPTVDFDAEPQFPPYPPSADAEGVEGDVIMLMCVSLDGIVSDASVEASSGDHRLDNAALAWVGGLKMHPALAGDRAVAVCGYRMELNWRLDE